MRDYNIFHSIEYVIHGSKIHIQSGYILLTLELCVKRLRRFGRPKRRNRFKVSSKSEWNLTTFNMLHDLKDVWFRRWDNAGITVAHRLRRWTNIIPALAVGHGVTKMCWGSYNISAPSWLIFPFNIYHITLEENGHLRRSWIINRFCHSLIKNYTAYRFPRRRHVDCITQIW